MSNFELNRIYNEDCIEGMRRLPDNSVDLIVIDPPYNIGKDTWDKYEKDDYLRFMTKAFKEYERVLKHNGSFYWFHNDFLTMTELQQIIKDITSFVFKRLIIWNKRFKGSQHKNYLDGYVAIEGDRNYRQMAEYCLFYTFQNELTDITHDTNKFPELRKYFYELYIYIGKTKKEIMDIIGQKADHCFRYSSTQWDLPTEQTYQELIDVFKINKWDKFKDYDELREKYNNYREEYEKLRYTFNNQKTHHSVWNYEIAPKIGHITPKPIELIENIIIHSSNEGDVVLDGFIGSGTTAVAAINTNRNFIGFEIEPEYVEIANKQIKQAYERRTA